MFLMSTLRSATSLSTTNCSWSEVARTTMANGGGWSRKENGVGGVHKKPFFHAMLELRSIIRRSLTPIFHSLPSFPFTQTCTLIYHTGLGQVRTATKRAGGTIRNHGGSPGKRLGIKKFSGNCVSGDAYCMGLTMFPQMSL
jgi:Ribosomal L27 protein